MRRALVHLCVALAGLAALAPEASAQTPPSAVLNQPSATLLLPYFEVDLDTPTGQTTLFSINNSSATAIMAHITIWTDMGVPVFAFNAYLTGYDVQAINLRDVLLGTVPSTASDGQDPADTANPTDGISNQGLLSQDINFASCTGILPPPPVGAQYLPYLRSALTGGPSSFHEGMCVARNHGTPSIARGYVTVNTTNQCAILAPSDPGYFLNGGSGVATNQNVLYGDYVLVNPSLDVAHGDSLVHIKGLGFSGPDPELITPGRYTFFGRLSAWTAADNREPLSTNFAAPFVGPKDFKTPAKARRKPFLPPSTELIVWRDPKVDPEAFACGSMPPWYPLAQEQILAFNEQEGTEVPAFPAASPPFPGATQRVRVGFSEIPISFESGWLFLNLNTPVAGQEPGLTDPVAAQAWVSVLHRVQQGPNGGGYTTGFRQATLLDSARHARHLIVPTP